MRRSKIRDGDGDGNEDEDEDEDGCQQQFTNFSSCRERQQRTTYTYEKPRIAAFAAL